jgi:hypothetical protein
MYCKPSSARTRAHAVPIPPLSPTVHAVRLIKVVHQARRTVTALECSPRNELRHPRSNGFCHGEPGSMKLRPARFERVARRLYRSLGPGTARGPPGFRAHHSRLRQDSSLHATRRLRERRMPQTVRGRHGSCSCASQTSSGSSARTRSWPSVCGSSSSPNQTATSPQTTTGRPPVSTTTT